MLETMTQNAAKYSLTPGEFDYSCCINSPSGDRSPNEVVFDFKPDSVLNLTADADVTPTPKDFENIRKTYQRRGAPGAQPEGRPRGD